MLDASDELIDVRVSDVGIDAPAAEILPLDFLEHLRGNDARDDLNGTACIVGQQDWLGERRIRIAAVVCADNRAVIGPDVPRDADSRRHRTRCQHVGGLGRGPVKPIDAQPRRQGDARAKLQAILDVQRQSRRIPPPHAFVAEQHSVGCRSQVAIEPATGKSARGLFARALDLQAELEFVARPARVPGAGERDRLAPSVVAAIHLPHSPSSCR